MSMLARIAAVSAAFVVASGAALAATPAASASSGGGCNTFKYDGWKIRTCISAHKNVVRPDFYVDKAPKGKGCKLEQSLYRNGDRISKVRTFPCKKGHVSYKKLAGAKKHGRYGNIVVIRTSKSSFISYSPNLYN